MCSGVSTNNNNNQSSREVRSDTNFIFVCAVALFTVFMIFFVCLMTFTVLPTGSHANRGDNKNWMDFGVGQWLPNPINSTIVNIEDPVEEVDLGEDADTPVMTEYEREMTNRKREIPSIIQWNVFYFDGGNHRDLKKHRKTTEKVIIEVESEMTEKPVEMIEEIPSSTTTESITTTNEPLKEEHENCTEDHDEHHLKEVNPVEPIQITVTHEHENCTENHDEHQLKEEVTTTAEPIQTTVTHEEDPEKADHHEHDEYPEHDKGGEQKEDVDQNEHDEHHEDEIHYEEDHSEKKQEITTKAITTTTTVVPETKAPYRQYAWHRHKYHRHKSHRSKVHTTQPTQMVSETPELKEDCDDMTHDHSHYYKGHHHYKGKKHYHHTTKATTVKATYDLEDEVTPTIPSPVDSTSVALSKITEKVTQVPSTTEISSTEVIQPRYYLKRRNMKRNQTRTKLQSYRGLNNYYSTGKSRDYTISHIKPTTESYSKVQTTSFRPSTASHHYWNQAKVRGLRNRRLKDYHNKNRTTKSTTTTSTTTSTVITSIPEILEFQTTEAVTEVVTTTEIPTTTEAVTTVEPTTTEVMTTVTSTSTSSKPLYKNYIPPRKGMGWARKVKKVSPKVTQVTIIIPSSTSPRSVRPNTSKIEFALLKRRTTYSPGFFENPSTPKVVPAIYFQSVVDTPESQLSGKTNSELVQQKPSKNHQYFVEEDPEEDLFNITTTQVVTSTTSATTLSTTEHISQEQYAVPVMPDPKKVQRPRKRKKQRKSKKPLKLIETTPVVFEESCITYKCRTYPSANTWGHHCSLRELNITETGPAFEIKSNVPNRNVTEIDLGGWAESIITTLTSDFCDTFPRILFYLGTHLGLRRIEPNAFSNCLNMQRLHLSDNHLEELPLDIFKDNKFLTWISFGSNKFTTLDPVIFTNTRNLIAIEMEGNQLNKFPIDGFNFLLMLRQLDLRDNQLTDIDELALFNKFPRLQSLYLCGNDQINKKRRKIIFECFDQRSLECDLTINC